MDENQNLTLRIVIADDHSLVRGGFAMLVKEVEENVEVIEANSLEQVTTCLSQSEPIDLLLLDLMMPGMDGVHSIKHIHENWPDVPIIIVSVTEDIQVIRQALSLGAMGYIPKTSTPDITNSAIKLVLKGGIYIPPLLLQSTTAEPKTGKGSRSTNLDKTSTSNGLTRRQLEVLKLIALGMPNKAIANELGLTENTIKMHISRLFKTLDVENRTEAVIKYSSLSKDTQISID